MLVRSRSEWGCGVHCYQALRRIVWDGDQILYEISAPGSNHATPEEMEKDKGHRVTQGVDEQGSYVESSIFPYGRVTYTHGPGIDAPLELIRMEYSEFFFEPEAILLHTNWRGGYDNGTFDNGRTKKCRDVATTDPLNPAGWPETYLKMPVCLKVDWPAPYKYLTELSRKRNLGPVSWMGSLIEDQRDATGQLYRRNRYYDPQSGRFTQEDPIGLAGGLNVYGYANGDPVSEPHPDCRRRQHLRGWSDEQAKDVLPRGAGAGASRGGSRVAAGPLPPLAPPPGPA